MLLEDLVKAYARKLGVNEDYLGDLTEEDGVYTLCVESSIFISINEYMDDNDEQRIRILSALNGSLSDDDVFDNFTSYCENLAFTSMYGRAHVILSEDNTIGLTYEDKSAAMDENSFSRIMDEFVATIMALTMDEEEEESVSSKNEILEKTFSPQSDDEYLRLLNNLGISQEKLNENFGLMSFDDGFSTHMAFHSLSDNLIFTNTFEASDTKTIKELLQLNTTLPQNVFYEYEAGYLRLVTSLKTKGADVSSFNEAIGRQRALLLATSDYFDSVKDKSDKQKTDSDPLGFIGGLV